MEYHEAVERLARLQRLRPKLGTETTAALLSALDDPHADLTTIQVAGSNGKGSTARILAAILRATGRSVGLYTSPDLNDVRERITVDGQMIPKSAVTRFVKTAWPAIIDREDAGDGPTFFEALTAMAFWQFDRADVDVAVLEVGIGGRYDATSVIDPVAAAVTNVSLEHTEILGSTIEEIARDKAQVAPADRPLVTGATGDALATIQEETEVVTVGSRDQNADSPAVTVSESPADTPTLSALSIDGPDWSVETDWPLLGEHQAVNAGIAAQLARQVASVSERALATGLRTVSWPGRFELLDDAPLVILDGAHNPDACAKLTTLLERFEYENLALVFGAMRDKDHASMARELPAPDHVFLAAPDVPRSHDVDALKRVFDRETDAAVERTGSVLRAVDDAIQAVGETDCVLVTGSLYMVAEARSRWTVNARTIDIDTNGQARATLKSADVPTPVRQDRADKMVGRTIRMAIQRETGRELVESMLSLGGTGAVSGLGTGSRQVSVVLSGSMAQFNDLIRQFQGRTDGGRHIATELERTLARDEAETGDGQREPAGDEQDSAERYPWSTGTAVMGILNVTPDSFHDGGEYNTVDAAMAKAREMVAAGADIVDVGGESTRPGADPVGITVEQERVVPVIEALQDLDVTVSIDTRKPAVAEAALTAGADMVNDVTGLADAGLRRVVADWDVPAVAMHSLSAPVDPGRTHAYDDVVDDVFHTLAERLLLAERAGIDRSKLIIDPGLGFGKGASESFELLRRLGEFRGLGCPLMVGHSHKSMFESVARDTDDRFATTVAATALAAANGADIVRVHDVAANVDAVRTATAVTDSL